MRLVRLTTSSLGERASALSPGHLVRLIWNRVLRSVPLLLLALGAASAWASAGDVNQAALVIVHGDGSVVTRCVAFEESQISGFDLLQRSGLDINLEASTMGATICRLDGEGCTFPAQSCFCQCEGSSCRYWSYWRWADGEWRYSQQGASNSTVLPGSIDGWVWGAGAVDQASPPPALTFADVCTPATPTPTATPLPATVAPTSSPTGTPALTPTATFIPTALPTAPATATSPPTFTPSPPPAVTPLPTIQAATSLAPPPVIEMFTADRREIVAGEVFTLTWRVANATAVELQASGRAIAVPAAGSLPLTPPQNTTYQLAAANSGGSVAAGMTIVVRPRFVAPDNQQAVQPTLQQAEPASTPPSAVAEPSATPAVAASATPMATPATVAANPVVITPLSLPTETPLPTLAPLVLVGSAPPVHTAGHTPTADAALPALPTMPPLMLVGLLGLVGVPLFMVAVLLALWWLRRTSI